MTLSPVRADGSSERARERLFCKADNVLVVTGGAHQFSVDVAAAT
jgi:hypothetical protein